MKSISNTIIFKLTALLILLVHNSCKNFEKSEINRVIVDYAYIQKEVSGYDSVYVENIGDESVSTYFFGDTMTYSIDRNREQKVKIILIQKNEMTIENFEVWETNGQIMVDMSFKDGILDGMNKFYHENGRLRSHGIWTNNYFWGDWKEYDQDGNLIKITHYNDDKTNKVIYESNYR